MRRTVRLVVARSRRPHRAARHQERRALHRLRAVRGSAGDLQPRRVLRVPVALRRVRPAGGRSDGVRHRRCSRRTRRRSARLPATPPRRSIRTTRRRWPPRSSAWRRTRTCAAIDRERGLQRARSVLVGADRAGDAGRLPTRRRASRRSPPSTPPVDEPPSTRADVPVSTSRCRGARRVRRSIGRHAPRLAFDRLAPDVRRARGRRGVSAAAQADASPAVALDSVRASACWRSAAAPARTRNFSRRLGVRVVACDPSEEMVSRTRRRLEAAGFGDRVGILSCGLQDLPQFLDALDHAEGFDAIVSNFGALNCAPSLDPLGAIGRRHLRAGGAMAIGLMGRACCGRRLYFIATRRSRQGVAPSRPDAPRAGRRHRRADVLPPDERRRRVARRRPSLGTR